MLSAELRLQAQGDEPPESRVSIFYYTHWEAPQLHGSVAGGEWRDFPFRRVRNPQQRASAGCHSRRGLPASLALLTRR